MLPAELRCPDPRGRGSHPACYPCFVTQGHSCAGYLCVSHSRPAWGRGSHSFLDSPWTWLGGTRGLVRHSPGLGLAAADRSHLVGGEGADQIGCTSSQEELDVTPRGPETAAGPGSGWDGDGRRTGVGPSGAQKPPGAAACLLSSPPVQTAGPRWLCPPGHTRATGPGRNVPQGPSTLRKGWAAEGQLQMSKPAHRAKDALGP